LRFTPIESLRRDGTAEELVDKPDPVGVEDVALTVLGDLVELPCPNQIFDLTAINVGEFARQAEARGELVELDLGLARVGPEDVAVSADEPGVLSNSDSRAANRSGIPC
jgi:hypothetical protein